MSYLRVRFVSAASLRAAETEKRGVEALVFFSVPFCFVVLSTFQVRGMRRNKSQFQ